MILLVMLMLYSYLKLLVNVKLICKLLFVCLTVLKDNLEVSL